MVASFLAPWVFLRKRRRQYATTWKKRIVVSNLPQRLFCIESFVEKLGGGEKVRRWRGGRE